MKKVTMNLTETDIENAERLEHMFDARSKAQAVSTALSLAAQFLSLIIDEDSKLFIEKKDGTVQPIQLVLPGIKRGRRPELRQ